MNYQGKGLSLCEFCQKYCAGCNWTRKFQPVDGWVAEERWESDGLHAWVGWCPEFKPDKGVRELFTSSKPPKEARMEIAKRYGVIPHRRYAVIRYRFLNEVRK